MATKAAKLTLKRHKESGSLYHEESGLVFKSATERLVTGRIEDGKVIDFDEAAYALCEQFGFKPDPELIQEEPEQGQEQAAEEEEPAAEPEQPKVEAKAAPKVEAKPEPEPKLDAKAAQKNQKSDEVIEPAGAIRDAFNLIQQTLQKNLLTVSQYQKENQELKKQLEDAQKKLAKFAATIKSLTELNG